MIYTFKTVDNNFNPSTAQAQKLEVITDQMVQVAMEMDQDPSNNNPQGTGASTSNASGMIRYFYKVSKKGRKQLCNKLFYSSE
ncbi:hypothetical protein PIROE2DRAFT_11035 [Piromyces sp. E2]|nr:hypothetical protein PIROE2DRAFT_11035 [Piromyces sp. E2]|eukprot:OUM62657.1 hypothetical protein PIROE2DRAFT_11035 [Piromyces sp. E2]